MSAQSLNNEIDQLRSIARDLRLDDVEQALAIAWYHAEVEVRERTGKCSSIFHRENTHCGCCAEFERLREPAKRARR